MCWVFCTLVITMPADGPAPNGAGSSAGMVMTSDIGKSTGPRCSTGKNSGGPVKTLIVVVLLSCKKNPAGSPSMGSLKFKKIRSCKSFGGPVKLGFSTWLPVLRSSKDPKVFPLSATFHIDGLVQERCNSIANALDLSLSCTNPCTLFLQGFCSHKCFLDVIKNG